MHTQLHTHTIFAVEVSNATIAMYYANSRIKDNERHHIVYATSSFYYSTTVALQFINIL